MMFNWINNFINLNDTIDEIHYNKYMKEIIKTKRNIIKANAVGLKIDDVQKLR